MKPFKKILVPVDFSACSAEAIRTAVDLARRYEAEMAFVHVFELIRYTTPEGYPFLISGQVEALLTDYDKELAQARKDAEAAGAERVTTHELQGIAATEIVEFAAKGNFDLIVMGTHG